jgi:REP element-mobilizing transposase RayT
MPYTKIWIHLVWSTKGRRRIISADLKSQIIEHIILNCRAKDIFIEEINCVSDHIHILISLHPDQNISKIVQLIKGESSHWVNKNKLTKFKFEWQSEYLAVSVSGSVVNKVKKYIQNQEIHHQKKSFTGELNEILKQLGYPEIGG